MYCHKFKTVRGGVVICKMERVAVTAARCPKRRQVVIKAKAACDYLIQTVAVNMMIPSYEKPGSTKLISAKNEREIAEKWIKSLSIKTNSHQTVVETLSGGNQQKVILGKWLEIKPKIIILNEPTRGIDVGAKVEIYKILKDMCRDGVSIIMITSEMPELIGMADRAIVMHEGELQRVLDRDELTEDRIMSAAIGRTEND